MIIIIPLGGIGKRFKKNNYTLPKSFINIFGEPIIHYLLDNLNLEQIEYVYIPYNKEYANYFFEDMLKDKYPNIKFQFFELIENTRGAAETLNLAIKNLKLKKDMPVLCLDGDNFYTTDIINKWNGNNSLITFEDINDKPIYSYVKLEDKKIIDIVEKNKISNLACSGAYGFNSIFKLLEFTQYIIDNDIMEKGEFYTSIIIKEMIKQEIEFSNISIEKKEWICLGTPIQLRHFYHNYPKISFNSKIKLKPKRICFDLDNTLVSCFNNDYINVKPIGKNIKFLKYLKSFGNTIIIYTDRGSREKGGNIGNIGKLTFETLDNFDIPYDEIYFGKPYADVYIDNLALNSYDDMEKYLGYYMDNIDTRSFNTLENNIIETYTKKNEDTLEGEIYYYRNIPREIKDLFGLFIDYDEDMKWYKMEKISGLTATTLYLSELLTTDNLKHIMNSIKRIQNTNINNDIDINIYGNYATKLKDRYYSYDYSGFSNSNQLYETLYKELLEYEKKNLGKKCIIHGDTVMTNIIINNFEKIKFIDMRGKIGDTLTIYGDWLYDWAKLYQSILGYDRILQEKDINKDYEIKMRKTFEDYFIEMFSETDLQNVKMITKSLLFSLIPLHDNEKCMKYYNLI